MPDPAGNPIEPFPVEAPGPTGPDAAVQSAYRAAVEAADAYRSLRAALRVDGGVLRVGNRFVSPERYREVAFLAVGRAANSMALATLRTFGERVTAGFVVGPERSLPEIPFRSAQVPAGWPDGRAVAATEDAAREMLAGLREDALFLLLVSPGAVQALAGPPAGLTGPEFAKTLARAADAGVRGRDLLAFVRSHGEGLVGGRFAALPSAADVATFVVDRGDGPDLVGGGPTVPLAPAERTRGDDLARQLGVPPRADEGSASTGPPRPMVARPVVIASPADALRAAADELFAKKWTCRPVPGPFDGPPERTGERFATDFEAIVARERLTADSRTKGVAGFATTTLGLFEGVGESEALERCLRSAEGRLHRRETCVAALRTAGAPEGPGALAAAVVGRPADGTEPAGPSPGVRPIAMRSGITDVGIVLVGLAPRPPPR